jgi:hypothetical protein
MALVVQAQAARRLPLPRERAPLRKEWLQPSQVTALLASLTQHHSLGTTQQMQTLPR